MIVVQRAPLRSIGARSAHGPKSWRLRIWDDSPQTTSDEAWDGCQGWHPLMPGEASVRPFDRFPGHPIF